MKLRTLSSFIVAVLLLIACNPTKYVLDGEFLLNKATIKIDTKDIKKDELQDYLRQTPNAGVFSLFRMQLGIYNLAPKDTTKRFSRFWHRIFMKIGDPPVIYNSSLTSLSVLQLQKGLENKGYMNAKVESSVELKQKKANVEYVIKSNTPYRLRDYVVDLKNEKLAAIASDTSKSLIRPSMLFDADVFNTERERITAGFRKQGYYNFGKDYLTYNADSSLNQHKVDVLLDLRDYLKHSNDSINNIVFKQYTIDKVVFRINRDLALVTDPEGIEKLDTVQFRGFYLITPKNKILKLDALVQNTYINPKAMYSDDAVEKTYQALNSLGPIKYVNISFKDVGNGLLECDILITPSKVVSLSTELEGTYTDGYWGVAGNISTVHRNVFKGAETLSLQLRGAFEKQDSIWAQELGIQLGLKLPRFMMPFGSYDFKRNLHANTEFTSAFSFQDRPGEFKTTSVGGGISYTWTRHQFRHSFQLFDLNYVRIHVMPAFRDSFLNTGFYNPNNYVDHFIMRMGYSGSYSTFNANRPMKDYSSVRYSIETAGNTLYGLSKLFGNQQRADGSYTLFNVRFAQYVKGEYNIAHHQIFDKDNQFVYHFGLGVGVPYGNANVIPYERRFFSGGANSVRGWSESTLGPGTYQRITGQARDFNQVGDIKLDLNMEYRAKLFWLMEGAAFLDAGNIWTIKNYDETKDAGVFRFDTFANQIAIAYGLGLRFDFKFFIFRTDLGLKLFDPVQPRREQWRVSPTGKDFAFHLAIGYPF